LPAIILIPKHFFHSILLLVCSARFDSKYAPSFVTGFFLRSVERISSRSVRAWTD
jgi:hypothetical protein